MFLFIKMVNGVQCLGRRNPSPQAIVLIKTFILPYILDYFNQDHLNPKWSFFVPFLKNYLKYL